MTKPHQQNLIGKYVSITKAANKTLEGIEGVVEDETKNTIIINGKTIIKDQITIKINETTIKGTTINKTLTERIKVHKK